MTQIYNEKSIKILKGLDAVRKRPGMYIGTTGKDGLYHLVIEILNNSVDEVIAGYCNEINFVIHDDESISIEDNGRGIPINLHSSKKSTPEVIFTVLHSGGKFDSEAYKSAGGLHGVGASVVNALSKKLILTINRDQKTVQMIFVNGGKIGLPLKIIKKSKVTGTKVRFYPDDEIFKDINFNYNTIKDLIRETAFLNDKLKITLHDERSNEKVFFQYEHGLKSFMNYLNDDKKLISPLIYFENKIDDVFLKISLQYVNDSQESIYCFANNIKTIQGGTHLAGFKRGLVRAINNFATKQNLVKKSDPLFDYYDIKEGLCAIINIYMPEKLIQFEGQTKSKLGTPVARKICENMVYENLEFWLNENLQRGTKIINKIMISQKARIASKKIRDLIKTKASKLKQKNILIKKLIPCQGNSKNNEIFIVEGNSAGGTAKLARDAKFQAILPLKGKVLNAARSSFKEIINNAEIVSLINALGTDFGDDFNLKKLNYNKIIIMTDADQDGAHIQTLILTFFYIYMKQLFINHKIFIVLAPLYKITFKNNYFYAWDKYELKTVIKQNCNKPYKLQRYKGLGEMNSDQLWETTMNIQSRHLIQINIEDELITKNVIDTLMGSNPDKRKIWINNNVNFDN